MPDLAGMKPYEAKVELEEIIDGEQIAFQTQDEIFAAPEKETDYAEWVVVEQSVSPGGSIGDEDVVITIKPTDEYMARRERIINEFIDNQEKVYGWRSGKITYTDLGDVLIVSFNGPIHDNDKYGPIGYSYTMKSAQVEADQLASALESEVFSLGYVDEWLSDIQLGTYSQSPKSAQAKAYALCKKIQDDGIEYAKANRETALDNLKKQVQAYDPPCSLEYEVTESGAYLIKIQWNKRNWIWIEGEENDTYRQKTADSAALYLCAPVSIGYINGDGSLYKHFEANPTSYLYDKDTDDYVK